MTGQRSSQFTCFPRLSLLALACSALWGSPLSLEAQVLTPDGRFLPTAPSTGKQYIKNSQGVPLMEVPGTPAYVAAWEVRVSDFAEFVRDSGYSWNGTPFFSQTGAHPVVNVTLRDALAFCNWLTLKEQAAGTITRLQAYRLPTRREWDAAVGLAAGREQQPTTQERELDQQSFPWGTEWPPPPRSGNFNSLEIGGSDDGYPYTAPVGTFGVSREGIYDLAGNVWEWTWDQQTSAQPSGVLRGGSWMYFRKECLLSNYQYPVNGETRAPSIGFRYVLEDKPRTSTFLAAMELSKAEEARQRRDEMLPNAKVSQEEVDRMRAERARLSSGSTTGTGPAVALPDASKLTPARPGQNFINSLGMSFRPLEEGSARLVGEHEVRVNDYVVLATTQGKVWSRRPTFNIGDLHPIVNVSWEDANNFCAWLTTRERANGLIPATASYRLPTDLEWSLAAGLRDETGDNPATRHLANKTDFPWGREVVPPGRSANLDTGKTPGYQDNYSYTSPVGAFSPNSLHLFDMAGNVAEWCADPWPGAEGEHVIRGSSWLSSAPETFFTSYRQHLPAASVRPDLGFRVMLELAAP